MGKLLQNQNKQRLILSLAKNICREMGLLNNYTHLVLNRIFIFRFVHKF